MRFRTGFALFTLLYSLTCIVWIGLDAWILTVWALVALVLLVLTVLGRLIAREMGLQARRADRLPWIAGAVAAFISCTMAAGLVRSAAPVDTFWVLGGLMVAAVVSLRLAYARPKVQEDAGPGAS